MNCRNCARQYFCELVNSCSTAVHILKVGYILKTMER